MQKMAKPLEYWSNAMQAGWIMAESQSVIAMRLWGMAGLWTVPKSEGSRMVEEKQSVFMKSSLDASFAALRGHGPADVAAAAMRPIRQKTRSNEKRLARRGPRRG